MEEPLTTTAQPNGLIFHIRGQGKSLVPMLMMLATPQEAREISIPDALHADLGVDRVAFVHIEQVGDRVTVQRLADVAMLMNGDSTTAKVALDVIVNDGRLLDFVRSSITPLHWTGN